MLWHVFPGPEPLELAGGIWQVSQLRLGDLAWLERWASRRLGGPWEALDRATGESEALTRRAALRSAYDLAEKGGRSFGHPAIDRELATFAGDTVTLWRSLRQRQRELSEVEAVALAAAMGESDWLRFARVAWWLDPLEAAQLAIDRELGIRLPPTPAGGSWERVIVQVARRERIPLPELRRLTLSQWDVLCRGGRAREQATPVPKGWSSKRFEEEVQGPRRTFWKEAAQANGHAHAATRPGGQP